VCDLGSSECRCWLLAVSDENCQPCKAQGIIQVLGTPQYDLVPVSLLVSHRIPYVEPPWPYVAAAGQEHSFMNCKMTRPGHRFGHSSAHERVFLSSCSYIRAQAGTAVADL
jgi:hypothetical protein